MEDRCERNSCVCGYHIYMSTWDAIIGKELPCERETGNERDRYSVAVKKDGMIIGHLPRKISRPCSLFLRRRNRITCCVMGYRRYSLDLPQGDLEIPCVLVFEGESKEISKIKKFVKPELKVKSY